MYSSLTMNSSSRRKLEAMEVWCYRRIKLISWVERISNERVLEMIGMRRNLLATIRKWQMKYVRHSARNEGIVKFVLEGKIPGKRQRGRRRVTLLGGLVSAVGCGEVGALRRAGDRDGFRRLVADVSPCHGTQRRRSQHCLIHGRLASM